MSSAFKRVNIEQKSINHFFQNTKFLRILVERFIKYIIRFDFVINDVFKVVKHIKKTFRIGINKSFEFYYFSDLKSFEIVE